MILRAITLYIKTLTSILSLLIKRDFPVVVGSSLWRRNTSSPRNGESPDAFINRSIDDTSSRIQLALDWIIYAQSLQSDGGVSGWILLHTFYKVASSYPEVTGYIIPTVLACHEIYNEERILNAAVNMADFELGIQFADGSFQGDVLGGDNKKSVFNTAQVMHGLVGIYNTTKEVKYLKAAIKAADWIISVQEEDGSWARYNYRNLKRVYDAKVSECLLELYEITFNETYRNAAINNLNFILENQNDNFWYRNCDNSVERNHEPLTHTIGYTLQGLLASGVMLGEKKYINAAQNTLNVLLKKFELRKDLLNGRYYKDWRPAVKSSCITGCAQISVCWLRLFEITGEYKYLNSALKMNDLLKTIQYTKGSPFIKGALPATYPVWGDYGPWVINSWGVKYYIDALVLEHKHKMEIAGE